MHILNKFIAILCIVSEKNDWSFLFSNPYTMFGLGLSTHIPTLFVHTPSRLEQTLNHMHSILDLNQIFDKPH